MPTYPTGRILPTQSETANSQPDTVFHIIQGHHLEVGEDGIFWTQEFKFYVILWLTL